MPNLCSKCKTELRIRKSYVTVEGDNSPDTPTQVFAVTERECRNKNCEMNGRIVETSKHPIPTM